MKSPTFKSAKNYDKIHCYLEKLYLQTREIWKQFRVAFYMSFKTSLRVNLNQQFLPQKSCICQNMCSMENIFVNRPLLTQAMKNIVMPISLQRVMKYTYQENSWSVLNDDHFWRIRSRQMWPKYIRFISNDVFRFYQHLCTVFALSCLEFWAEEWTWASNTWWLKSVPHLIFLYVTNFHLIRKAIAPS